MTAAMIELDRDSVRALLRRLEAEHDELKALSDTLPVLVQSAKLNGKIEMLSELLHAEENANG